MTMIDLSNCDREPIHIPGKIQEHGVLIAIDKDFKIAYCSENVTILFPFVATTLLGQSISVLSGCLLTEVDNFIPSLINIAHISGEFDPVNPYPVVINNIECLMILSTAGELYLVEFEWASSDLEGDLQKVIGSSLSMMLGDANLSRLVQKTAEQIRKIIHYDRVMVYKFHGDDHGEVVAEDKNAELLPLMGLHYPASDIPKQARELYKFNLTRLIADVDATPSSIVTFDDGALDLTNSSLRAVSPVHIQYLKNMGVASSFSVSLIHNGDLWGLVACHNYTPRFINYKQRDAARLIGQVLSSALSFRQLEEDQQSSNKLQMAVDDLTRHLLRFDSIEEALFKHEITILDAVDSTGAVLIYESNFYKIGLTPDNESLKKLIDWLNENMQDGIYGTNHLSQEFLTGLAIKDFASGLLACRLSKELKEYLLWFRPEVISEVKWAGDPNKPVDISESGMLYISPRKSFEAWSQQVKLTASPWRNEDFRSALQLKEEVTFAINRKATEVRVLNDKLKEAYDELDSFSYTISHDLKNPLTTIKSYSQLLKRSADLKPKEQNMLDGILNGANRMQGMIEEVLNYSRSGQIKAKPKLVNMSEMLFDLKEQLLIANEDTDVVITLSEMPDIFGDETMIQQVFSNLAGNAIKYSSKLVAPTVEISGQVYGDTIQYAVRDNGIGIKDRDQEVIFDLFKRSDDVDGYEGSGVGLAIVKKIMEKHHGRVWVESELGLGSTFYIAFNKVKSQK
jgi:chemotaxis family two-component system sensor kinase Cph1